jgi:hypothetical protein
MANRGFKKLVAVVLLVVCPATLLMAERPTAMLYATGLVTLNGAPAAKSVSVFDGDRVDTANASVASINRNGASMVVDPNSSVQYKTDGFTILKGTARVRTFNGAAAHTGPLSVIPKANAALFDVSNDGKTVLIASREGELTITDGIETATLEPGYTAKVVLDSQQDQDQGPKPAAHTRGDETNHKKGLIIIIIASAAAAALIACILACEESGGAAVTPVTP